jgi:hypothetical protein
MVCVGLGEQKLLPIGTELCVSLREGTYCLAVWWWLNTAQFRRWPVPAEAYFTNSHKL